MTSLGTMSISTISPVERRRHPRTPLKMRLSGIRLDPDGGEVVDSLQMLDISRSGLGAICDRSFYPGQRMVLCLPLSPDRGRRNVYARVVRCRKAEEGFQIGVEFDASSVGNFSSIRNEAALAA